MRKVCSLIALSALSACGPKPHISFPGYHVVALGEPIAVAFGWYKTCRDDSSSIFDKHERPSHEYPCDAVPSTIDATCSGRCDVGGTMVTDKAPTSGFPEMTVVPGELGAMVIVAKLTRTGSGEVSQETEHLDVRLPGVEICALGVTSTERFRGPLGPCDHAALDPRNARVTVRLYVPDPARESDYGPTVREIHSDLAKVNDLKLPITSTVALADLFPNAVSNGVVQPGSYQLVVSVGDRVVASQQVVVGPAPDSAPPP